MPQISPESYRPTAIEWGISIGLIAATIFLFGLVRDSCRCCRRKRWPRGCDPVMLLADWTSLHLDLLARERGLKRMAASLYEVDAAG